MTNNEWTQWSNTVDKDFYCTYSFFIFLDMNGVNCSILKYKTFHISYKLKNDSKSSKMSDRIWVLAYLTTPTNKQKSFQIFTILHLLSYFPHLGWRRIQSGQMGASGAIRQGTDESISQCLRLHWASIFTIQRKWKELC